MNNSNLISFAAYWSDELHILAYDIEYSNFTISHHKHTQEALCNLLRYDDEGDKGKKDPFVSP